MGNLEQAVKDAVDQGEKLGDIIKMVKVFALNSALTGTKTEASHRLGVTVDTISRIQALSIKEGNGGL